MLVSLRGFQQRHPRQVGLGLAAIVTAVVVVALWGQREDFATAIEKAPLWLLGCAVLLQIVALLTRTEAWRVCVLAAGGTVGRRRLYRASSMGYVGSLVNAQLGAAGQMPALGGSGPAARRPTRALRSRRCSRRRCRSWWSRGCSRPWPRSR